MAEGEEEGVMVTTGVAGVICITAVLVVAYMGRDRAEAATPTTTPTPVVATLARTPRALASTLPWSSCARRKLPTGPGPNRSALTPGNLGWYDSQILN